LDANSNPTNSNPTNSGPLNISPTYNSEEIFSLVISLEDINFIL